MSTAEFRPDFSALRRAEGEYEEYGRFQQHLILLEDPVRLQHYDRAIERAAPGGVVVDVGAGTGILGLLALKRGFDHAFLIEPSRKIASYARYLYERNGFGKRYTLLERPLERVAREELPAAIDLVVTETISSLILGFGSWDAIETLAQCLGPRGTMVPWRGTLFGFFSEQNYATRADHNFGLRYLKQLGLDVDLFFRAFRSGGNVFDAGQVNYELSLNQHRVLRLLDFDAGRRPLLDITSQTLVAPKDTQYLGMTIYWELTLSEHLPQMIFSCRDPNLTSWSPYFVPFDRPLVVKAGQELRPQLRMLAIDAPYPYAFQLLDGERPLTHVLFW